MEFLFKHCRDAELSRKIKKLVSLWRRIEDDFYLQNMLHYLIEVCGNNDNADKLIDLLIQELPEEGPVIMTYGEQLRKQGSVQGFQYGMQEGIEQGREQGIELGREQGIEKGREAERRNIVQSLLLNGLKIDLIAKSTGLTPDVVLQIKKEMRH